MPQTSNDYLTLLLKCIAENPEDEDLWAALSTAVRIRHQASARHKIGVSEQSMRGKAIHHINGNPRDNDLNNLLMVNIKENRRAM
jgi:hypothetical protein